MDVRDLPFFVLWLTVFAQKMFSSLNVSTPLTHPARSLPTFTQVRVAGSDFDECFISPCATVVGGSNFGPYATSEDLRASKCTSGVIMEDKSNYWTPTLYFQWANGSFTSVDGTVSVKYLFNPGEATPFPDDFRMLAGNESDFTSDETFLCLNPLVQASRHDALPALRCPGGLRSQVVRFVSPHSSTETNSRPTDVPELLGRKGVASS
jgi:hypothetical protein